jgi:cysteine desulfuration protein SufE
MVPFPIPNARHCFWHARLAGRANSPYIGGMANTDSAQTNETQALISFDEIVADFELLDDWEDRYRYVIELGRKLPPLPDEARKDANKVQGCVSQVWLATRIDRANRAPRLSFLGDSDAHIVRGLITILFALYSDKTADAILAIDANDVLSQLHLKEHLTPQRSNGLVAMVERIRRDARAAIETTPTVH